jgi:hypothetical protein
MPDQTVHHLEAHRRHLTIARTALHRAADLLETARLEEHSQAVDEVLELVFIALEELDSATG